MIKDMKIDFSSKFDNVLSAVDNVSKEIKECTGRISQTETCISVNEDNVFALRTTCSALEEKVKSLTAKVVALEGHSRRNNLRLINLPEGAERKDACSFLEQWLPEALDMGPLRSPVTIERAHRVTGRSGPVTSSPVPRALIKKFLSHHDRIRVVNAAKAKGNNGNKILSKNIPVLLFPDLPTDIHKQQKRFDEVKRRLRARSIRYGMMYPAHLRITHEGDTIIFETPTDAENFLDRIYGKGEASAHG